MAKNIKKELTGVIESDPIAILIVAHAICDLKNKSPDNKMSGLVNDEAWEESLNTLTAIVTGSDS